MRPERVRQQPHHFIRRQPRARRDKRGPSEYVKNIEVTIPRYEVHRLREGRQLTPEQLGGLVIAREVTSQCKPGWRFEKAGKGETFQSALTGEIKAVQPIRFIRVK